MTKKQQFVHGLKKMQKYFFNFAVKLKKQHARKQKI